jgi:hypothetical protein
LMGTFILVVSAVGLFLWLALPFLQWAFQSPMDVFITWITTLSFIFTSLLAYGKAGSVILHVASGFVPLYLWVAVFALTGLFGLLWVASFRKFANLTEGA